MAQVLGKDLYEQVQSAAHAQGISAEELRDQARVARARIDEARLQAAQANQPAAENVAARAGSELVVCPRNDFTLAASGRRLAETPDFTGDCGRECRSAAKVELQTCSSDTPLVTWRFATARAPGDYLAAPQLATGCKLGGRPRGRRSANIQPVVSWRWDPDLTWRRAVVTWGGGDAQAVVRGVARPLMGVLPLPRRRWLGVRVRYAFCVHERPQAFRPFRVFAVVAEPDPVLRVNAPRAFGILWSIGAPKAPTTRWSGQCPPGLRDLVVKVQVDGLRPVKCRGGAQVPVERGPSGGRAVRAETLAPVGLAVAVARSCLRVVFAGSRAVAPVPLSAGSFQPLRAPVLRWFSNPSMDRLPGQYSR